MGDSKTSPFSFQNELLGNLRDTNTWEWVTYNPPQHAIFATTTAGLNATTDAWLAAQNATPDFVCINIGINDVTQGTSQATFETNLGQMLDKIHLRWPNARILVMRVWRQLFNSQCDTFDDVWIPNVLATRSPWAVVGPDERVFLKHTDNGVSRTTDGVHPNAEGYHQTALAWQAAIESL
jgi:lysophospholipase L1-like esterase